MRRRSPRESLKGFARNVSGNFGLLMGILALPLVLAVGMAVDGTRYMLAESHLQDVADGLSLALAASPETDEGKLTRMADGYLAVNRSESSVDGMSIADLKTTEEDIHVTLAGSIDASFMELAGYKRLPVSATSLAMRSGDLKAEVVLVLDNTYSMSIAAGSGKTKLDTLKMAATDLVNQLLPDEAEEDGQFKIGLVPYADYVNVGTDKRGASWLRIESEYYTPGTPATCEKRMVTEEVCTGGYSKKTCSSNTDGVVKTYECNDRCLRQETRTSEKNVCTGGTSSVTRKWFGCVGSRMPGETRLHDRDGTTPYPGLATSSQTCFDPILPLTDRKASLVSAISAMKYELGGYRPLTYIPSGLIWGVNVLSPQVPFSDAAEYDPSGKNEKPRKIMILMTDGENTLEFRKSDGRHVGAGNSSKANADTEAICAYAKSQKIEIFTVAFMVTDAQARSLLQNCASDSAHYYDATDAGRLLNAFSGIARSIGQIRLAR